jgi:uncharacterized protein (TIGR01244 family)
MSNLLRRPVAAAAPFVVGMLLLAGSGGGSPLAAQTAAAPAPAVTAPAPPPPPPATPFGIEFGREVNSDLLAAGQPTAEQLAALAAAGYRGVLDLRTASEPRGYDEATVAAAAGLTYTNLPISGPGLDDAALDAFVAALAAAPRPLLLHCASSNRVGAMLYGSWVLGGMAPELALEKARAAGLRSPELQARIEQLLAGRGIAVP